MPRFDTGNGITRATMGATYIDAYGRRRSVAFDLPAAATGAQITAIHGAAGDISNAAQLELRQGARLTTRNVSTLVTFDELFDMSSSLVMVYASTLTGEVSYFEVPSPDASIMANGTVNTQNTLVLALDVAIRAANPNVALQRVYLASRKVNRVVSPPVLRLPDEAGALTLPPETPGTFE